MKKRYTWTTKVERALVLDTPEVALWQAKNLLGFKAALFSRLVYAHSQGGWVIYNEAGTKMVTDRSMREGVKMPTQAQYAVALGPCNK